MKKLIILLFAIPLFAFNANELRYFYNPFKKECSPSTQIDREILSDEIKKKYATVNEEYSMSSGRVTILLYKFKKQEVKRIYTSSYNTCQTIKNIMD